MGIPASLNYVYLNETQDAPLHPYPNWREGCLAHNGSVVSNRTVVSTFRVNVDKCDRLWVVDNGVSDMSTDVKQVTQPSVLVFNLRTDELLKKFILNETVLRDSSVLTSIIIGDKGPKSQATSCDIDLSTNVLFYTQVCKNGLGCWNLDKKFSEVNTPLILSDCNLMEFPNDVKADREGNLWILSDRQSRFLYEAMDFDQVNFRVLTAPTSTLIQGTACEKKSFFSRISDTMVKVR
ncbi:unnamed protein product [Spodoptera exigua]|nr:unnamed protein product [Spodoptera exigua]